MINSIMERAKKGEFTLIAEIGVNYYDIATKENIPVLEAAKLMVREAKEAGIHAVKFQSYKAETLAAKHSPSYWDTDEEATTSQYKLFKKFDSFGINEYKHLAEYCESIGIEFLSTAFDIASADYLYDLMNVYKISSSDLNNLPFVEYQAKKGKSIVLSVGASTAEEIHKTIETIKKHNSQPIVLMHCVLEYPTPYANANLNKIVTLKNMYPDLIIGYSDHTKPDVNADIIKTAHNLGAVVIEKHFTLDKTLPGNDHYHAMDKKDAFKIINDLKFVSEIKGSYELTFNETESAARLNARRSLVSLCEIRKGEILSEAMFTFKRPGIGISPSELTNIIGKVASEDIPEDTILQNEMITW